MKGKFLNLLAITGSILLGLGLLIWWLLYNPTAGFTENIPGMDGRPESMSGPAEAVRIGSVFASFDGVPADIKGSWPRFRGTDFDNIVKENIPLIRDWGSAGPLISWSVPLGEGHAGPVISNGRVYVLDYDEEERADMLRCFSLEDGQEIWRRGYKLFIKRNHGISRTVPAVSGNYVVAVGPKCHVMCVDAVSGDFKWGVDLQKEYSAEVPLWYTGQCPVIEGSTAIIAVGGSALIIGLDCETGQVAWEIPNPGNWKMSHSSIIPIRFKGQKIFLYCAIGGITGFTANGEQAGQVVFSSTLWNNNVIAPSPVWLGDGRIFVTAGYGAGSMMLRLKTDGDGLRLESLQKVKPVDGLASEQQTPIFYKGRLFGILPKDAGPMRNQFVCCHPDDIGTILWSSGKTNRFGLGPYIVADGKFFILDDDGVLTIAKAGTGEYIQLGQAKVLDGVDAWGPMAIAGGRLLARDSRKMVCIDLRVEK